MIITDYWMPEMTGYDLLKKIKVRILTLFFFFFFKGKKVVRILF